MANLPSIRWGIITAGIVSAWFIEDLVADRPDAKVNHIIQSIGSSSIEKGKDFLSKYCPNKPPKLYNSYDAVYTDPDVDIVYIGTPHAFHKQNCLDAIAAGKNILCEKAFTLNSRDAKQVFEAAKQKGIYIVEAMKLRHWPIVHELRRLLHEEKVIGDIFRMFSDFGLEVDISNLPASSRYKDLKMGAGTLLDAGIYPLTWAMLTLDPETPQSTEKPEIMAAQTHHDGIEVSTSAILHYRTLGRQANVTSSTLANGDHQLIAKIHGTDGFIKVEGPVPSMPLSFTVYPRQERDSNDGPNEKPKGKRYEFPNVGRGFIYEADNAALDVLAGRKESELMPWAETVRVMEIMDEIRRQGGTVYPADLE